MPVRLEFEFFRVRTPAAAPAKENKKRVRRMRNKFDNMVMIGFSFSCLDTEKIPQACRKQKQEQRKE